MEHAEHLKWRVLPCAQSPRRAILIALLILGIWASVYLIYGLFWTALAVLMTGSAVAGYYLPSTYALDDEFITVWKTGIKQTWRWSYFRRYHIAEDGVFLSPFQRPNRKDNFRGVFLPFDANQADDISAFVRQKMESAGERPSP
ncbi:MAG: hypothetical protein D6675_01995 [Gemmatimonadetes bacterium]|nr:MAG: hypothetical protein D6675_01995 [Gemmatimonadota bacterium]